MTDIVDRLRAEGKDALAKHASLGMYGLCSDAADEIERLRSSLADAFSAYFQTNDGPEAVAAEREACAKIAETMDYAVVDCGDWSPGKVISGTTTIDNRDIRTPQRIAAAIRARGTT